jgi:hypothetical protein
MNSMKNNASRCTLIGDIVGSRGSVDRADLHRAVEAALRQVDDAVPSLTGLRVTVGDEFQGSYATLGEALDAGLRVRLALLPDVDTRVGIGRGSVTTLDPDRGIEDGPGWWAARSAVEAAEEAAAKPATRHVRTALRVAPSEDDTAVDAVNAALLCRDHLVGSCSERSIRLLRGAHATAHHPG